MRAALREPLLHFVMLGLAVFGLFSVFDRASPALENRTIVVDANDVSRLAAEFEATWRRPPQQEELDRLTAAFVREEVYVREAIALGLDRDDAIIRRRLQLKMEFLTEAGAEAVDPDDATLAAHLAEYPERFARAPLLAFDQVLLEEGAPEDLVLEQKAALELGTDPQTLARPSLLPPVMPESPPQVVDATFGTGFFETLSTLPVGEWSGPVASAFGLHLVRVNAYEVRGLPPLVEVRDRVLQDWRSAFAVKLRDERYEAMKARYEIVLPTPAEVADE